MLPVGLSSFSYTAPAFTDYNQDSLPDLMLADNEGKVYLYLNTGTASAPAFEGSTPVAMADEEGRCLVTMRDMNGDGNEDMVLQRDFGRMRVFLWKNASSQSPVVRAVNRASKSLPRPGISAGFCGCIW